jgi:hypothetical protein
MMPRQPWDWPPENGRFEKIEILPPRQPRIDIHVRRQRSDLPQRLVVIAAVIFVCVMLLRNPGGLLVAAAIVGPSTIGALVFGVLVCTIAALIQKKRGKPF